MYLEVVGTLSDFLFLFLYFIFMWNIIILGQWHEYFLVFIPSYRFKFKIFFIESMTENHNSHQLIDVQVSLTHLGILVIFYRKILRYKLVRSRIIMWIPTISNSEIQPLQCGNSKWGPDISLIWARTTKHWGFFTLVVLIFTLICKNLQVLRFLSDCSIPWQELNNGCLIVKMKDVRNKQWDMSSLVWFIECLPDGCNVSSKKMPPLIELES